MGVLGDISDIYINRLDYFSLKRWASSNQLKSWVEQNDWLLPFPCPTAFNWDVSFLLSLTWTESLILAQALNLLAFRQELPHQPPGSQAFELHLVLYYQSCSISSLLTHSVGPGTCQAPLFHESTFHNKSLSKPSPLVLLVWLLFLLI